MVYAGKEQPFERGVSGSRSYLDHEATTSISGGSSLIKLIQTQQVPKSKYLREAAIRISTDIDYVNKVKRKIEKDKDKQKYINPQKGVR